MSAYHRGLVGKYHESLNNGGGLMPAEELKALIESKAQANFEEWIGFVRKDNDGTLPPGFKATWEECDEPTKDGWRITAWYVLATDIGALAPAEALQTMGDIFHRKAFLKRSEKAIKRPL